MKKILLFVLTASIAFYACKKDNEEEEPTPTQEVDTNNPQEMTAAVKVYHATNVNGALPVATGATAPKLATASDNQTVLAVNGRYAVISPEVESGDIAGYYVQLTGADSHFKLDYAKPLTGRKKPAGKRKHLLKETGENQDSAIVIQLPANAKPGTFCVEYAAYDTLDQVSNKIKVCITIIPAGAGADGKDLAGSWKMNRIMEDGVWKDYYRRDTTFDSYACENDTLRYCLGAGSPCFDLPRIISKVETEEVTFADNGTYHFSYEDKFWYLTVNHSSCVNPDYQVTTDNGSEAGGWSYNSTTKKLTIVYDYDGGVADYDYYTVSVTELSSSKLVLKDVEYDDSYEYIRK